VIVPLLGLTVIPEKEIVSHASLSVAPDVRLNNAILSSLIVSD